MKPDRIQSTENLSPQEWREVRRLLDKLLQLPQKEQSHFLDDACATKPRLRNEIESLLSSPENPSLSAPVENPVMVRPQKIGKYLLTHKLGEGGMAEVYLAISHGPATFEKWVAVKKVHVRYRHDKEISSLFEYEARLSGRLNHANIVQVYDFLSIDDSYLLAMEYVDGLDLLQFARRLREDNILLPVPCALYLAAEICKGLDYAHTRHDDSGKPLNLIHRDISPKNIMLSFEGDVKVVDFGIAKGKDRMTKTQTGALRGTALYIAPEIAAGGNAQQRSDLFAVAVILYELLSNQHLFESENLISLIAEIKDCSRIDSQVRKLKLDPEVERVLVRGLQRLPENRYASAADFGHDLQLALSKFTLGENPRKKLMTFLQEHFSDEMALRRHYLTTSRTLSDPSVQEKKRIKYWPGILILALLGLVAHFFHLLTPPEESAPVKPASQIKAGNQCNTLINSNPVGARVSMNGISVGTTPASVPLDCGVRIEVALEYPGYETFRQSIRVTNPDSELTLHLEPLPQSKVLPQK